MTMADMRLTGGWRRLWVLRQTSAGDSVLGAQLLRRVWQRRRHDECWRDFDVLLPGITSSLYNYYLPS